MALDVAQGIISAPASAGQVTTTVGFEPKVVLFWWGESTSVNAFSVHAHAGFGWTTGTAVDAEYAVGVSADDNLTTNQAKPRFQNDACILMITDANPGVVTVEANLFEAFSTTATGFKLDFVTTVSGARIHYLALGGADISNIATGTITAGAVTGNTSTTAPGFQPDFELFLSDGKATIFPGTGGKGLNIGAAISSTSRWATASVFKAQNAKAGKAGQHQLTTRCILTEKGNATEAEFDFVSQDTNGFTVNCTKAKKDHLIAYLAIKGSVDFSVALGVETQKTSTGTKANTAPGFKPDCIFLVGCNNTSTAGSITDAKYSIGASDGTNESSRWAGNVDNPTGNTEADDYDADAKVFVHVSPGSPTAVDAEADLSSFDTNGFTLDWTTADATAREFCYLAMKGAAASGISGSGSPSAATATASGAGVNKNLGSGTPQAATATASGAGVNKNLGSGTPQADTATSSGAAVGANKASGTPQAATATASGAGINKNLGSGTPQAGTATSSGAGVNKNLGSGTPQAATATASGAGVNKNLGSGTPQAATATASGAAVGANKASGTPQAATATASGAGTVSGPINGSGSPQADTATASGAGVNKNLGSGSPQAITATVDGVAVQKHIATGAPQAATATAAGAGVSIDTGLGTVQAVTATASGAGVNKNLGVGIPQADTATSTGVGTVPGQVLSGIPAGFYSIANCIKDPDFLTEMRDEANGAGIWCEWDLGVDLIQDPIPKRTGNLNLDIALIQNEAEGLAVWARWAPGVQPENTGNLQLDMVAALTANFILSV